MVSTCMDMYRMSAAGIICPWLARRIIYTEGAVGLGCSQS